MSLRAVFTGGLLALALLLGYLFALVFGGTEQAVMESAAHLRDAVGAQTEDHVERFLGVASHAVDSLEVQLRHGLVKAEPASLRQALVASLLAQPTLSEATLTVANVHEWNEQGYPVVSGRPWQLSVYREGDAIWVRQVERVDGHWQARTQKLEGKGHAAERVEASTDPAEHPTFLTPARRDFLDQSLWSDLHYAERDPHSVVVTLQRAVTDSSGHFIGVARLGLLTSQLDRVADVELSGAAGHRIFLCDAQGRLVTRLDALDKMAEDGDDLRVRPHAPPAEVSAVLRSSMLKTLDDKRPAAGEVLMVNGRKFAASYRRLPQTQDWVVAVVAPLDAYLGGLQAERRRLLAGMLVGLLGVLLLAGGTLQLVQAGLAEMVRRTQKMREFDFEPTAVRAFVSDVSVALHSLERAKTAMRAMGRYVPIDLVRDLFRSGVEPTLGGAPRVLSMLFTDIEGFTTITERTPPDELAERFGLYLQTMTRCIHDEAGTVDKFIGDAVMALWNAPEPCPDHAVRACAAALRCRRECEALFASTQWNRHAPFVTRFGIHTDEVLVGHFGAPDRMSYTVLGDGVNVASRLEGLNKQYGTHMLVSGAVYEAARERFSFRRLDRVSVKGKSDVVEVYELLGEAGERPARVERYEHALAAYFDKRFAEAAEALEAQTDDPPSRVLRQRCLDLLQRPVEADWTGIFHAEK
jgi:adenylate cyclase